MQWERCAHSSGLPGFCWGGDRVGGGTVVRDEGKLEGVDRGIPLC